MWLVIVPTKRWQQCCEGDNKMLEICVSHKQTCMSFQVLFYCRTFHRVGQDKTGHLVDFCALTLKNVTDVLTRFLVQLRKIGTSLERC